MCDAVSTRADIRCGGITQNANDAGVKDACHNVNIWIQVRTNALRFSVVESKPGVARHTLRSAVHGTMDAGLWGAIPARAYICCERTTHRIYYDDAFLLGFMLVQVSTRAHTDTLTYEHTWPSHG